MTLEERVIAGVKWLDSNVPGWKINPDTLNMKGIWDCVLGKVFGEYNVAIDTHPELLSFKTRCDLGFTVPNWNEVELQRLQDAWIQFIKARQQ